MPEQPAQPGIALDFGRIERHLGWRWWSRDCRVSKSLVRTHGVVMALVFPDQVIQMVFPEYDEMIETLLLYTLNKPFGKSVQVGRPVGQLFYFDPFAFENLVEFLCEFRIAVPDQIGCFLPSFSQVVNQIARLLLHGHWQSATFIAALRHDGLSAPWLLDGPMDGDMFLTYVRQVLGPELRPGDLVISLYWRMVSYGLLARTWGCSKPQNE